VGSATVQQWVGAGVMSRRMTGGAHEEIHVQKRQAAGRSTSNPCPEPLHEPHATAANSYCSAASMLEA
jgi:hypothetical protein